MLSNLYLGHENLKSTQIYTHVSLQKASRDNEKISSKRRKMNLDYLNINNSNYKRNLALINLLKILLDLKEGVIGLNGALMVDTGEFSGRIPNDKFIVDEDSSSNNIWWGNVNQKISEKNFDYLLKKVTETYNDLDNDFYVFDGFAGDDKDNNLNVRMVTKKAWQSLFVNNMFIRPKKEESRKLFSRLYHN